jgi:diguanylate cyclase (GGDEF)-like protein/PAS domain S-box-containing protein
MRIPVCIESMQERRDFRALRVLRFLFLPLLLLPSFVLSHAGNAPGKARVLRTIAAVYSTSPDDARKGIPVELDAVVTYADAEWGLLFVHDSTGYMFLDIHGRKTPLSAGSRIAVTGSTGGGGDGKSLTHTNIRVTGNAPLPVPEPFNVAELNKGAGESHLVNTTGVLQSCDTSWDRICYRITDGTATAWVVIPKPKNQRSENLIGAKVRVKGISGSHLDASGKRSSAQIFANSLDDIAPFTPVAPAQGNTQVSYESRTIQQIHTMSMVDAARAHPVELKGVVIYSDPEWGLLFIDDPSGSIYVNVHGSSTVYPLGAVVRVDAVTAAGDTAPIVTNAKVTVVGRSAPPNAQQLSIAQLNAGVADSSWVSTVGVLRPCDEVKTRICFRAFDGKSSSWVIIPQPNDPKATRLIGATVRIKGVSGIHLDASNKPAGAQLFVNRLEDLEVQGAPLPEPFALPLTPIGKLGVAEANQRFVKQVHVRGLITWNSAGRLIVQDASGALSVMNPDTGSLLLGQLVDVVGFPSQGELTTVMLSDSMVRVAPNSTNASIAPLEVSASQVLERGLSGMRVRLSAQLVGQSTNATEFVFFLDDGKQRFSARLPRNEITREIVGLPEGAFLKLTGVAVIRKVKSQWPESFQLLVPSPSEIVLDNTGWFTVRHVLGVLGIAAFVVVAVLIWVGMLRRTVRKQTALIRSTMENELQMATQYQRLFERNLAAVFRWRPDGSILDFNMAFVKLIGLESREQLEGRCYWDFEVDAEEREKLRQALLREEAQSNRNSTLRRDDGRQVYVLMNITPVDSAKGMLYETTAIDISQLRRHQAELQTAKDAAVHESLNDALTGLPNRKMLALKLDELLEEVRCDGSMLAMLYIDLDGFKAINDSLGHAIGDGLLVAVAARLRSRIRQQDILARMGGDEFVVILDSIQAKDESALVGGNLLSALSNPFSVDGHEVSVGASVGISIFPDSAIGSEELIKEADSAMYVAKREGKGRMTFFTPEIGARVQERLSLEKDLRGALQRNEITLHYQPEFELLDNRLIRFEALARWTHPTLGSIPPGKFIPIAEESGLIVSLGNFIMEQACIEAAKWQGLLAHPLQIAVNVSSIQFRRKGFVEEVLAILEKTGLAPSILQIELTESVMMGDLISAAEIMQQLRNLGISLAIDDFGTGFSSMSNLRSLPFDTMKIDSSFVRGLGTEPESESMVDTLIVLAHSFSMRVIVEGVETASQLKIIEALGADEVQGYFTGRPNATPLATFILPAMETKDIAS